MNDNQGIKLPEKFEDALRELLSNSFAQFLSDRKKAPNIPLKEILPHFVEDVGDRMSSLVEETVDLTNRHKEPFETKVASIFDEIAKEKGMPQGFTFAFFKELYEKIKQIRAKYGMPRELLPLRESRGEKISAVAEEVLESSAYLEFRNLLFNLRDDFEGREDLSEVKAAFRKVVSVFVKACAERELKFKDPFMLVRDMLEGNLMAYWGLDSQKARELLNNKIDKIGSKPPLISLEEIEQIKMLEIEEEKSLDESFIAANAAGLDSKQDLENDMVAIKGLYNLGIGREKILARVRDPRIKKELSLLLSHDINPPPHLTEPEEQDVSIIYGSATQLASENEDFDPILNSLATQVFSSLAGNLNLKREDAKGIMNYFFSPLPQAKEGRSSPELVGRIYSAVSQLSIVARTLARAADELEEQVRGNQSLLSSTVERFCERVSYYEERKKQEDFIHQAATTITSLSMSLTALRILETHISLQAAGATINSLLALQQNGILNPGRIQIALEEHVQRVLKNKDFFMGEMEKHYYGMLTKFVTGYQGVAHENSFTSIYFGKVQAEVGNSSKHHRTAKRRLSV